MVPLDRSDCRFPGRVVRLALCRADPRRRQWQRARAQVIANTMS